MGLVLGQARYAVSAVVPPRMADADPTPSSNHRAIQVAINDVARTISGKTRNDHVRTRSECIATGGNDLAKQAFLQWKDEFQTSSQVPEPPKALIRQEKPQITTRTTSTTTRLPLLPLCLYLEVGTAILKPICEGFCADDFERRAQRHVYNKRSQAPQEAKAKVDRKRNAGVGNREDGGKCPPIFVPEGETLNSDGYIKLRKKVKSWADSRYGDGQYIFTQGGVSSSIGRAWGPIPKLSRWAYTGIVRTGLTYAVHLWAHHLKARHRLRLDFNQFTITGPSTSMVTVATQKYGVVGAPGALQAVTTASRCLTDTFSAVSPSGQSPPSICGINTGEHMYVDSNNCCNELAFQLGAIGRGTALAARQWSIKAADRQPFSIRFLSDNFENQAEIMAGAMKGFKLTYIQNQKWRFRCPPGCWLTREDAVRQLLLPPTWPT
eukprot:maker-scaffold58_size443543-snap-gene-1.19 protein:Tk00694 transcript:maker-scaffold58_size443543-snap-gene-1.19-mRNA-1 annotation:"PREDICTED: uncharacterized protein LOC100904935"